ncbi:MAG: precorrin-4 C(11)-methyltransferase, partial [Thermoproteota archaeon]|nr:precorrin-4 C(11)-methyltransferase [Thermoproteota archaeon]
MVDDNTIYFVGCGPGDPDLITLKAMNLMQRADVIIYSGSLINPRILDYAKNDAELYDASLIDRQEISRILSDSAKKSKLSIRLHDGDPAIFSTIREQIDKLEEEGLKCKVVPGVTSLLAAAAEMNLELTLPGITQTLIITRAELRTPVPEREKISELAKHRGTLVFYLSVHLISNITKELLEGNSYTRDTPVAVVYRAGWENQVIIKGTLENISKKVRQARIIKTALIIIGDVLEPKKYEYSKVYDPAFTHGFRRGS